MGLAVVVGTAPVEAQVAPISAAVKGTSAETGVADDNRVGRVHDAMERSVIGESPEQWLQAEHSCYLARKAGVLKDTGFHYAMDVSLLQQWGLNGGGSPSLQVLLTPSFNWDLFSNPTWGSGSLQFAYNASLTYPTRQDAVDIQSRLGLVTAINDMSSRQLQFVQLSYTHTSPGKVVSMGIGQYPFDKFDGNEYLANQQRNFNNAILVQDGATTYPVAGLGAFVQWNVTDTVQVATGFQGANNLSGQTLSARRWGSDGLAWFGYLQWTPKVAGMGTAQYSASWFSTPAVPAQEASQVWSINAVQNVSEDWAVFARANRAIGHATSIRGSWALGAARNNPLGRNSSDQIAIAIGRSEVAAPPANSAGARNETIVETYWNWALPGALVLSPSAQLVLDPAFDRSRDHAWILGLRATMLF
ncbi:MAG: carbohydrate porin [Casimicrobiaceae bacterium]